MELYRADNLQFSSANVEMLNLARQQDTTFNSKHLSDFPETS